MQVSLIFIYSFQGMSLEKAKVLYERLVKRFPSAGRYWRLYIEQEVFRHLDSLLRYCNFHFVGVLAESILSSFERLLEFIRAFLPSCDRSYGERSLFCTLRHRLFHSLLLSFLASRKETVMVKFQKCFLVSNFYHAIHHVSKWPPNERYCH